MPGILSLRSEDNGLSHGSVQVPVVALCRRPFGQDIMFDPFQACDLANQLDVCLHFMDELGYNRQTLLQKLKRQLLLGVHVALFASVLSRCIEWCTTPAHFSHPGPLVAFDKLKCSCASASLHAKCLLSYPAGCVLPCHQGFCVTSTNSARHPVYLGLYMPAFPACKAHCLLHMADRTFNGGLLWAATMLHRKVCIIELQHASELPSASTSCSHSKQQNSHQRHLRQSQ